MLQRIDALPEPARGLARAMIAWYPLVELRREAARPLELPELGIRAELYGDATDGTRTIASETLGLLRMSDGYGVITTGGIVTERGTLAYPDDCSICQLHAIVWYLGALLVPSVNLSTLQCMGGNDCLVTMSELPHTYEYLTGTGLDEALACRYTFAVTDLYIAVHIYDYAEGSGVLELWYGDSRCRLTTVDLPLRVLYMQWQGQRLHVTTAADTIVF